MFVFKECQTRAKDWEHRLEEGLNLWHRLHEKAKPLENWISAAERALSTSSGDNSSVELLVCLPYPTCIMFFLFYSTMLHGFHSAVMSQLICLFICLSHAGMYSV